MIATSVRDLCTRLMYATYVCNQCTRPMYATNVGEPNLILIHHESYIDVRHLYSPSEIGPKYAQGENRVYTRFYCRFLIRTIGPFILWNISRRSYSCIVETHPPPSWRKYNNTLYILYFHLLGILCLTIITDMGHVHGSCTCGAYMFCVHFSRIFFAHICCSSPESTICHT